MNSDSILQILSVVASSAILWRTEPLLNVMTAQCRFLVRFAFWMMAVGALSVIGSVLAYGYEPSAPVVLSLSGAALLLVSERRLKNLARP